MVGYTKIKAKYIILIIRLGHILVIDEIRCLLGVMTSVNGETYRDFQLEGMDTLHSCPRDAAADAW